MKVLLLLFSLLVTQTTYSQSLNDLFKVLENKNIEVQKKKLNLEIAKQQKKEAVSGLLPQLSLEHTSTKQDSSTSADSRNTRLSLSQNIFAGGAEYRALDLANTNIELAQEEYQQSLNDQKLSLAQYFYDILSIQSELKLLKTQEDAIAKRVSELEKRKRIGRSRAIDVLTARSQRARVLAESMSLESDLNKLEAELRALIQWNEKLQLKDEITLSQLQIPVSDKNKLLNAPSYKTNQLSKQAAELNLSIDKTSHIPSLDLAGNYYLNRTGTNSEVSWDVSLNASWSLFSGGGDRAQIKQSEFALRQAELSLRDLQNKRVLDWQRYYNEINKKKDAVKKLKIAAKLSKETYEENLKELKLGLVNSIDVFRAEEDYMQIKRSALREEYRLKKMWFEYLNFLGAGL
jgi:outer membrane protein TolC